MKNRDPCTFVKYVGQNNFNNELFFSSASFAAWGAGRPCNLHFLLISLLTKWLWWMCPRSTRWGWATRWFAIYFGILGLWCYFKQSVEHGALLPLSEGGHFWSKPEHLGGKKVGGQAAVWEDKRPRVESLAFDEHAPTSREQVSRQPTLHHALP